MTTGSYFVKCSYCIPYERLRSILLNMTAVRGNRKSSKNKELVCSFLVKLQKFFSSLFFFSCKLCKINEWLNTFSKKLSNKWQNKYFYTFRLWKDSRFHHYHLNMNMPSNNMSVWPTWFFSPIHPFNKRVVNTCLKLKWYS